MHRLNMATSKVIVVTLNKAGEREPKKYYIARVWSHLVQDEGVVAPPLICDWPNQPRQKVCFDTTAMNDANGISGAVAGYQWLHTGEANADN